MEEEAFTIEYVVFQLVVEAKDMLELVTLPDMDMLPDPHMSPTTVKAEPGVVVPIPRFPFINEDVPYTERAVFVLLTISLIQRMDIPKMRLLLGMDTELS